MADNSSPDCGIRGPENQCLATVDQIRALPLYHRENITDDYLDAMGHMNVRWYMAIFDNTTWQFFNALGLTSEYFETRHKGMFALRQFINYFSEVLPGHTVSVHTRLLGRTDKRFHFMHFMVNDDTGQVAASFESMGTHADLELRRSAPLPDSIAEALDAKLEKDRALTWEAPACGVIKL